MRVAFCVGTLSKMVRRRRVAALSRAAMKFPISPDSQQWLEVAVIFPLVYLVTLTIGRLLKRRAGVRLGVFYQLFCLALALFVPLWLLNVNVVVTGVPSPETGQLGADRFNLLRELGVAVILLGIFFFLALLQRYCWELYFEKSRGIVIPKFLSQIVALVIIIAAALVVLAFYGVSIKGAVLGSTVVVGIIGFAMQDLLGNIIAGIAIHIGKPYKEGDWLKVEGEFAEVMEINWRSTRLRNNDDIFLDIPNATIAKNTIVNINYHTREYALRMRVGIDYKVPPNRVKAVLHHAAATARGVLKEPPPKVFLVDFGDSSISYEVKFWMANHRFYNDTADALRTGIWYELHRAGITIPFPIRTLEIKRRRGGGREDGVGEKMKALVGGQAFFACMDEEQVGRLLNSARLVEFGRDERIIEMGEGGQSMFILASGSAAVHLDKYAESSAVATLKAGDCFGEMSLLTGEPRSATVVALSDCEALEIGKSALAPLLEQNEELLRKFSDLLAQRRIENEGFRASALEKAEIAEKHRKYAAGFLGSVAKYFGL
jgi:small-conductance mechanosensitive channel